MHFILVINLKFINKVKDSILIEILINLFYQLYNHIM